MDTGLALQIIACGTTLAATWLTGNKHVLGPGLNIAAALCFAAARMRACAERVDLVIQAMALRRGVKIHPRNVADQDVDLLC